MVWKWYADVMEDIILVNKSMEGELIREQATLLYVDDSALEAWDLKWLYDATHMITLASSQISEIPKLLVAILEKADTNTPWKAINAAMKALVTTIAINVPPSRVLCLQ